MGGSGPSCQVLESYEVPLKDTFRIPEPLVTVVAGEVLEEFILDAFFGADLFFG